MRIALTILAAATLLCPRSPAAETVLVPVIQGDWWISSAERPKRGVSIAPVKWQPMTRHADVLSPATLPPDALRN